MISRNDDPGDNPFHELTRWLSRFLVRQSENHGLFALEIFERFRSKRQLGWCDSHGKLRYVPIQIYPQICKTSFYNMASLCFLLLLLTVKTAFAAKVLGYSAFGSGSHYYVVSSTLQELARTRGTKPLELFKPRLSIRSPVSVKSRLRTGDCRTGLKCELQTTDSLSIYPVLPSIEC